MAREQVNPLDEHYRNAKLFLKEKFDFLSRVGGDLSIETAVDGRLLMKISQRGPFQECEKKIQSLLQAHCGEGYHLVGMYHRRGSFEISYGDIYFSIPLVVKLSAQFIENRDPCSSYAAKHFKSVRYRPDTDSHGMSSIARNFSKYGVVPDLNPESLVQFQSDNSVKIFFSTDNYARRIFEHFRAFEQQVTFKGVDFMQNDLSTVEDFGDYHASIEMDLETFAHILFEARFLDIRNPIECISAMEVDEKVKDALQKFVRDVSIGSHAIAGL